MSVKVYRRRQSIALLRRLGNNLKVLRELGDGKQADSDLADESAATWAEVRCVSLRGFEFRSNGRALGASTDIFGLSSNECG